MAEQSHARRISLDLGELVDLELQLREDRHADPIEVRRRDEKIGAAICAEGVPDSRAEVLLRWIEALHPQPASTPGRRLAAAYRLSGFVLVLIGLVSGASAALALLRYDGGDPVNVISYLAVLVGLQLLLSALAVVTMLPQRVRGRISPLGPLHAALRELGLRRAGFDAVLGRLGESTGADTGALKAWSAIYGEAERWRLLGITQRGAVAFNAGALAASLYAVTVRALAFAWSTTLDVEAATVHRAATYLSAPWAWAKDAVPSIELVAASRYYPGGQYDPAFLGDWWPFLFASLLAYGLLPRVLLWMFAERRGRQLAASLEFDHGDARAAYQRLTQGWAGDADRGGATTLVAAPVGVAGSVQGRCRAYLWADVPLDHERVAVLVKRRTRCTEVAVADAPADPARVDPGREDGYVIVAEAWEAPTRALGRMLSGLRERIPATTPIVVLLVGRLSSTTSSDDEAIDRVDASDVVVWRRHLAGLGDPYLFVDDGGSS